MAARYRQGLAAGRQRVLSVLWAPSFIAAALPSTTHGADDGRRQAGGEPAGRLHSPPLAIKSGPSYSPWAAPLSLFVLVEHLAEEEEKRAVPHTGLFTYLFAVFNGSFASLYCKCLKHASKKCEGLTSL